MDYTWMDDTPVGRLLLAGSDDVLQLLLFDSPDSRDRHRVNLTDWQASNRVFKEHRRQLRAYFNKDLKQFDAPVAGLGTAFQQQVWSALCEVPYGETATYGEIAKAIGRPTASRAVGMANGRNPISIIVPCHRIIGASGRLVGYGGGLAAKTCLLSLEGIALP